MNSLQRAYEYQIHKAIDDWGRHLAIIYNTSTACSSCRILNFYDPINKESKNANCSTCDGKYYYNIVSTANIHGVVRSFVGDMKSIDYSLAKFGYVPEHDARITCWLEDVLLDVDSATGPCYLDVDYNSKIYFDSKYYKVKATSRTGIDNLKVVIATLSEVKL